ncbi:hypothetical protein TNCV_3058261 [Trichonephila clavipes]|nr:hypothetical protein TNCV_3058261 [Trichonephila clavipes]
MTWRIVRSTVVSDAKSPLCSLLCYSNEHFDILTSAASCGSAPEIPVSTTFPTRQCSTTYCCRLQNLSITCRYSTFVQDRHFHQICSRSRMYKMQGTRRHQSIRSP